MPTKRLVPAAAVAIVVTGTRSDATTEGATQSNPAGAAAPTKSAADPEKTKRKPGTKAAKRSRGAKFTIDLSDVPPQPLVLKNELSGVSSPYRDNSRRRPVKEGVSSRYTGVYRDDSTWGGRNRWKAQIMIRGAVRSLGYWRTEEEAASAYAKAAFKYKPAAGGRGSYGGLDLSGIPPQPLIANDGPIGYKGVKTMKGRFQARVSRAGKSVTLGTFDTAEEAAGIYARAVFYLEREGGGGGRVAAGPRDRGRGGVGVAAAAASAAGDGKSDECCSEGHPSKVPDGTGGCQPDAVCEGHAKVVAV